MYFRLYPLRFSFVAREAVHFPEGKSGNLLRGAFGSIFRKIACVPECPGARECPMRGTCPYARMFEPAALDGGPSGLADWPRPFVFRATHLDGKTVPAGGTFSFDLNLFDMSNPAIAYFTLAFGQLAHEGLGPGRGLADLSSVEQLDERGKSIARIYDGNSFLLSDPPSPLQLNLAPVAERVERVVVRFVTPTELKSGQQLAERPDFGVLAARIRDRLSTLKECYDDGPLVMDFRGFGERAGQVRMTRCEMKRMDVRRRSSRTGQVHPIGGFVGEAEYEGELSEFVGFLKAAQWVGVGRQTVWGKGKVRVDEIG
ncbi:MAG: CRISPR system precrRNA processing endoribonuclease RAMP protein Cas6 [Acidobacteriia bacterium]|nr:CRISPR system precrRNA processing endoribonuclease RAMP protein Cas6 [Terriglobia bacterium]